jgi:hypothetical protein
VVLTAIEGILIKARLCRQFNSNTAGSRHPGGIQDQAIGDVHHRAGTGFRSTGAQCNRWPGPQMMGNSRIARHQPRNRQIVITGCQQQGEASAGEPQLAGDAEHIPRYCTRAKHRPTTLQGAQHCHRNREHLGPGQVSAQNSSPRCELSNTLSETLREPHQHAHRGVCGGRHRELKPHHDTTHGGNVGGVTGDGFEPDICWL